MFILDHNFWTRNFSRSSKVSKDSDFSLLSNKNFSEILPSSSLGPGEVGQGGLRVFHSQRHSQEICNPQPKKFFFVANYKTCQVFWAFEQLSNTYSARVTLAHSRKATCDPAVFVRTTCINPAVKVTIRIRLTLSLSSKKNNSTSFEATIKKTVVFLPNIDNKLSWKPHVKNVKTQLSRACGVLSKFKVMQHYLYWKLSITHFIHTLLTRSSIRNML